MPTPTYLDDLTDAAIITRMRMISTELERLNRFDTLTTAQQANFEQITAEFSSLERTRQLRDIKAGARSGQLHSEAGSTGREPAQRAGGTSDARGRALDALTRAERTSPHLGRSTLDTVARYVETDTGDAFSRYVTVAADPAYRSAFTKLLGNPTMGQYEWDDAERQAFARTQELQRAMALTDVAGGYMIPFDLDPAIVLANGGTSNTALRSAFTVRSTVSDVWRGITSAGVTASWDPEAAEVSDDSPTLGEVAIPVYKGQAFIPFSFEVGMDATNFAAEMAKLLADAKQRLEATAFITGSGIGQPTGLITSAVAAGRTVASATADTYTAADVYALKRALPPRWRDGASWLANDDVYDLTRQFSTGTGPQSAFWTDFGGDTPARLLGRPVYETSEMDGTLTAGANNYLLAYGDLRQYFVVDRVGSQVELVSHLFGANGRPTGQRGFLMWFRTGGALVVPDAVRVLNA
jgi:HK97 family phage major capsid protein